MTKSIIEVEAVSKRYQLGSIGARTLRDEVQIIWERLVGGRKKSSGSPSNGSSPDPGLPAVAHSREPFWALRDISFSVHPGEVVGIVGRNGAGKSTLLKILSRITEPTSGEALMRGRVASLLEVGTGFHGDLSGRENVFLNGAILGMTSAEIRRKFDEIVDFSEVGNFIDTPVKRYSSGMYVRLAFAVAAHLEPEILIIDEVLAVGDQAFQNKCIGKMNAVASEEGRTVMYVSHNLASVKRLCTRALVFESGQLTLDGKPDDAIHFYLSKNLADPSTRIFPQTLHKSGVQLEAVTMWQNGEQTLQVRLGDSFCCEGVFQTHDIRVPLFVNFQIHASDGTPVLSSVSWPDATSTPEALPQRPLGTGTYRGRCEFPRGLLNAGHYTVNLIFLRSIAETVERFEHVLNFEVMDDGYMRGDGFSGPWMGLIRPKLAWSISAIE